MRTLRSLLFMANRRSIPFPQTLMAIMVLPVPESWLSTPAVPGLGGVTAVSMVAAKWVAWRLTAGVFVAP